MAVQIRPIKYVTECAGRVNRQHVMNTVIMAALFLILTSLAAFRLEVGNDYGTYVVTCHEIFQRGYVVTEPGYNLVVRILYTLSGKEDYLLMFGVFGAAIAAVFLKIFKEQSDNFALSFFMFMTMGIYFRTFNTVRYYFALAIAVYALRYVVDITKAENAIKFLFLISFAATFHKSVLIVIPIYLFARMKWNAVMYSIMGLTAAAMLIFKEKVMDIALKLYPSYQDTVYIEQTHNITENWTAVAGCVLVLILGIVYYRTSIAGREDNRLYFQMNIMAIVLYLSCYYIPLVTRFGYYLITPGILLVPGITESIENETEKRRIKLLVAIVCILYFGLFLRSAYQEGFRVLPYKSWLFYDRYWLNQTDTF